MAQPLDIAIIGMAGAYAGAGDAPTFWQNILDKVDAVAEAGPEWAGPYLDPDSKANDRIYTTKGGFLRDLAEVDLSELGVMPNTLDGGEPDHMLALRFARDALADAGYLKKPFDRERIGIVLGRGTYANRGVVTLLQHGLILDQTLELVRGLRPDLTDAELATLKAGLKQQLPPYNAEMVGLLTPNVIAGLIANRLDLMGPNFIVDAACASSLIAIELAVREINSGRCDMMITGGVQAQCPPQLYMQFCQLGALSHGQLRPFQKGADGTLLGEGVGVLVLKKLALAEADGDRIYAVIKGIGSASDGKAKGLLTPRLEGEVLALKRAYESSGIDPATIGLVEAHGTGTRVGDKTEIESLSTLFGPRVGELPTIALGSVKSMISHCLPAAGSASMIKTALALHHKVLPPMLCDEVDPDLHIERTPFYINTEARPWIHGGPHPRRAGVNAFGFGGINAHVILEEYRPSKPVPHKPPAGILHVPGQSELVALAADTVAALIDRVNRLLAHARGPSKPSLAMLARAACAEAGARAAAGGGHRLAVIASDVAELIAKLEQALGRLAKPDVPPFRIRGGVHYGRGAVPGKVCFVFPGEGAQYGGMLGDLALNFPQVREWFDFIDDSAARRHSRPRAPIVFPPPTAIAAAVRERLDGDLYEMDVAAETVFAASIGLYTLLDELGFEPDAMLGHSTGENTALTASGVRRYSHRSEIADTVRDLNRIYRELDREGRIVEGSLLTIGALKADDRAALLADCAAPDGSILVAMDNCPNQLVLFGSRFDIADLKNRLTADGAICAELPFGRAYHTALFAPVADAYREYYADLEFGPGRTVLYSACSVGPFPDDAADIRELACQQWQSPVRFTETVERLYEDGVRVFVEVGPSGNLTSFIDDVLREKQDLVALSTNSRRKPGITHLHQTLAQLFALGVGFDPAKLFSHRQIPLLDLDAEPPAAARRKPKIKLQMPLVHLPAGTPPLPAAVVAAPAAAPTTVAAPASVPAALAPAADTAPPDPRLEALKSHFALMQDFLDSQARVLDGYAGNAASAAVAVADPARLDPQLWPLLGRIVEQDERHLICERRYDLDADCFLQDHALGSAPSARQPSLRALSVIPFTFSMEIVAEAACLLTGDRLRLIGLDGSRGHRWLGLDGGTLDLRISAERIAANPGQPGIERVAVRLFQLGIGGPAGGILVFESTALLAAAFPAAPDPRPWTAAESRPTRSNPDGTLYSRGMFHGPRLQGVRSIRRWADEAIEADMVTIATTDYFRDLAQPRFRTDPALLDAAGQVVGYWLTERHASGFNCFPYHVGSFRQYAPMPAAGSPVICRCDVRLTDALRIEAHLDVLDADGRLLMRATHWEDRKFTVPERYYAFRMAPQTGTLGEPYQADTLATAGVVARRVAAFDDGFLDQGFSIWKRVLANLVLNEAERREWYALPAVGVVRERALLVRIAAKEAVRAWLQQVAGIAVASADVALATAADGRLHVESIAGLNLAARPSVSVAGPDEPALAACVGPGLGIGIDCRHLAAAVDAGLLTASERHRHAGMASPAEQARALAALVSAKHAAARSIGGSVASGEDWQVVDGAVPQAAAAVGALLIRHAGRDHPVALHLAGDEVFALSLTPEAARHDPRATPA